MSLATYSVNLADTSTVAAQITALGNKYVRTTRFVIISSGTSGTVTLPPNSEVVLDDFGGTVDAVVTQSSGSKPTQKNALTATGVAVATTFDTSGNWAFSGTPSSYPVAIVYRVRTKLTDFDSTSTDIWGDDAVVDIVPVAEGGTGISSGNSGGVPYFSSTGTIASSAALTANQITLGGGAGSAPATLGSLGTISTVLHGNAGGSPSFGAVSLTADISGVLALANGGVGITVGTSGGVPYFNSASTVASSAALAANQLVLGGGAGTTPATLGSLGTVSTVLHGNAAGAPTFGAVSLTADISGVLTLANGGNGITVGTSGGVHYFNSTTTTASSALLTANQIVLGGGAGTAPATLGSLGTVSTVLHGNAGGAPTFGAVALASDVSGTLPVTNGGIGINTVTQGDVLYSSASNTLAALAKNTTATRYITNQGTSNSPTWGPISLADGSTGILAIANGGSGSTVFSHANLSSLTTGDPHSQYAFLAGRSGGQTLVGGTAASDALFLDSTSNATKGAIVIGASGGFLGIGTPSPTNVMEIRAGASTSEAAIDGLLVSTTNTTYTTKGRVSTNYDRLYVAQNAFFNGSAWVADNTGRATCQILFAATNADASIQFITSSTNNAGQGTERMRLDKSGNLGIGTAGPSAQLHTTGSVRFANFGSGAATFDANGNISSVSDERLKDVSSKYDKGLTEIDGIVPIVYRWKKETGLDTENDYVGFSAQNVLSSLGDTAVGKAKSVFKEINNDQASLTEFYSISDRAIMATIVNSIKELKAKNDDLEAKVNKLLGL